MAVLIAATTENNDSGNTGDRMSTTIPSPTPPHWNEHPKSNSPDGNNRSVTPAMNNTRGAAYAARASSPGPSATNGYGSRSSTPNRYYGAYNASPPRGSQANDEDHQPPASTGLIRLTLRKPMGIVFEPMYDPHNASIQKGVRICDLPRTGAAALSRKLEIGDELLSINDKTMSRLTFDEIMDFIIEADPDKVSLLFRRPRREALAARASSAAAPASNAASVKWVDDDARKPKDKKKAKAEKKPAKRSSRREKDDETLEEDETIQSVNEESTYDESMPRRKSRNRRRDPYQSESFLDMLIDTICANPDVCKDRDNRGRDEYYSDDDETFNSLDDSTYVTYESELPPKTSDRRRQSKHRDEESEMSQTADDTLEENIKESRKSRDRKPAARSPSKEKRDEKLPARKPYEDDNTLETAEQTERLKEMTAAARQASNPLGLEPTALLQKTGESDDKTPVSEDEANPAPITELEYDERFNADVSVMESLGGPSLLIEKQRASAATKGDEPIPLEIVRNYGKDFPADFGLTREQTAQRHPMKFYSHVVKGLLEENEPEKVRLLDKLLAKYKGREDHLVQKLNVRYEKAKETNTPTIPEEEDKFRFASTVNKTKDSAGTAAVVETARDAFATEWPEKTNVQDEKNDGSEISESGSEYSGDSIDGTSPAVIAQVSELLNYVYGKTSVPGQIDRVSTIMRAYEGREAVLLELLETKALIKANSEKENAANLPSFLRNSPALQNKGGEGDEGANEGHEVSPLSTPNVPSQGVGGTMINDDVSSMSGVSSPAEAGGKEVEYEPPKNMNSEMSSPNKSASSHGPKTKSGNTKSPTDADKKKKKGIFKGLFGGGRKKGKDPDGSKKSGPTPKGRKLKMAGSGEGSI